MEESAKNNTAKDKRGRKIFALFIVIVAYYFTIFDWELPAIVRLKFNWPYTLGMGMALCWSMADGFLKHVNTPNFQKSKLIKTHAVTFLIYFPAAIFLILPTLGPPRGVWSADYKTAFLASFFFITAGPKIAVNYERFAQYLSGAKKDDPE